MTKCIEVSSLENIDLSCLDEIESDNLIFISAEPGDTRTKDLINRVRSNFTDAYTIFVCDEGNNDPEKYIENIDYDNNYSIIIDTSLIRRSRLAGIFNEIYELGTKMDLDLYIFYSLGAYVPPNDHKLLPNKRVASVHPRFMGWDDDHDLKVLTIVGLGYEKDKAVGAVEYLESLRTILFIPESSEEQYLDEVLRQNEYLIKSTSTRDQIYYDVENPVKIVLEIDAVLSGSYDKYKPILLPFGPKIFYACSLLVAMVHPEASVWYVSGEEHEKKRSNQEPVSTFGMACRISAKNHIATSS